MATSHATGMTRHGSILGLSCPLQRERRQHHGLRRFSKAGRTYSTTDTQTVGLFDFEIRVCHAAATAPSSLAATSLDRNKAKSVLVAIVHKDQCDTPVYNATRSPRLTSKMYTLTDSSDFHFLATPYLCMNGPDHAGSDKLVKSRRGGRKLGHYELL